MGKRFLTSLVSVLFLAAAPAFATETIDDDGLDRLTAAGAPVVITSSGGTMSNVAYSDISQYNLTIPANAQTGLQALTIQNVVGEAQLLVNLNVLSASSNVAGTNQQNFSLQSWGSTLPIIGTGLTVDGVSAASAAPCGVANSCSGGNAGTSTGGAASSSAGGTGGSTGAAGTATVSPTNNIASPTGGTNTNSPSASNLATATAGNGGNAAAAPGGSAASPAGSSFVAGITNKGAASTSPGVISPTTSASGDLIVNSQSASNGVSNVGVANNPTFTLNFASQAQTDLSALFISNVVGTAQMAMNLNIASATLNLIPSNTSQPFANPINTTSAVIEQVNIGYQFRGSPIVGSTGTSGVLNISGH